MNIGLIDVDAHANSKHFFPNLALCKISRYHKQRGDVVQWAIPFMHYDTIYVSKIFNWSEEPNMHSYSADEIKYGGTGFGLIESLEEEIDRLQPDYTLYKNMPSDTAYGFLTRGCPNKCPWCVVPRKEGMIRPYMDIDEIAIEWRKKIILMDNNILASGEYGMEQLQKVIERGYVIDFNQAMDARLVNDENAKLLSQIKWINNTIRFGCDTTPQIAQCERAISLLEDYGFHGSVVLFTMIGGKNDINECLQRINHWRKREIETRKNNGKIHTFVGAQPYRDVVHVNRMIPQWQKDMARWANRKTLWISTKFEDFEVRKGVKCSSYFKD